MNAPVPDPSASEAGARKRTERLLVFVVSFLGLLILAGITAVVLRIIYLSSNPEPAAGPSEPAGKAAVTGAAAAQDRLDLPPGAVVKSVSIDGDRLAVHYEAPDGAGIAVVDLATGAVIRRIGVVPGGPKP